MNKVSLSFCLALSAFALYGCKTTGNSPEPQPATQLKEEGESESYVFAWGNLPDEIAKPRGGTSRGSQVELAPARPLPLSAIDSATSDFEKDRAAILSLAGDYRAGFHFLETMGLYAEHSAQRPYHSWATEKVLVVEDSGEFISLQHILVMYFEKEDGSVSEPFVMKHWRQDWSYQDTDLHAFVGNKTWQRDTRAASSVAGTWSQAVWQVDDSPRYEAVGKWEHTGNRSTWTGENTFRPLPRREHSVRNDYDVMEGFHRITLTPQGWLHEQNNWKRVSGAESDYRGHEIGIDRYELIKSPTLNPAVEYWEKSGPYWAEVRAAWRRIYAQRDQFTLKGKVDGKSQFEHHFQYAGELAAGEAFSQEDAYQFAADITQLYLEEAP